MLSRWGLNPDTRGADGTTVLAAAAQLDVSEFEIFRLAHRAWFGRDGDEKSLERIFVAYMFHGKVPLWVRHLCRDVMEACPPPMSNATAGSTPDLDGRQRIVAFAVAVTAAVFFMTTGTQGIPPGCPGTYVEPSQSIADTASRPLC